VSKLTREVGELHGIIQGMADHSESAADAAVHLQSGAAMLTLPRQDLLIVLAVQGRSTAGPSSRAAATSELAGRFTVPSFLALQEELRRAQISLEEKSTAYAEAMSKVEERELELENAQIRLAEAESRVSSLESKTFMQALNKPATFTGTKINGKPALSIRDWVLSVQDYTTSINLSDRLRVTVAESYLGGDAKRDWHTKRKVLQESNTPITFEAFSKAVIDSWDPACSDVKARTNLDSLKYRGNMTVYVSMFDRNASFIPSMTDDEKVHRFLANLRRTHPSGAKELETDPSNQAKSGAVTPALREYALQSTAAELSSMPPSVPKSAAYPGTKSPGKFLSRKRSLPGAMQ